jgi:hypothetical protein
MLERVQCVRASELAACSCMWHARTTGANMFLSGRSSYSACVVQVVQQEFFIIYAIHKAAWKGPGSFAFVSGQSKYVTKVD